MQPRTLGSLELTKLATEELLADMVSVELLRRQKKGGCPRFNFMPLCFYLGYQGRSSLPSNFDCSLGTVIYSVMIKQERSPIVSVSRFFVSGLAHGAFAALVVKSGLTGYVTTLRGLAAPPEQWLPVACPATAFLRLQSSYDFGIYPQNVSVVPSDMVRLQGKLFHVLSTLQQKVRPWFSLLEQFKRCVLTQWEEEVRYTNPGPIQFNGALANTVSRTLLVEHKHYLDMLAQVQLYIDKIRRFCGSGASETALQMSVGLLSVLYRLHSQASV